MPIFKDIYELSSNQIYIGEKAEEWSFKVKFTNIRKDPDIQNDVFQRHDQICLPCHRILGLVTEKLNVVWRISAMASL